MTAIRFLLTLWDTTHAIEYVRLGRDMLMFMRCSSPAIKELYAMEISTRLTVTGLPEPADLIMKKSVQHVQKHESKVSRPGLERWIQSTCEKITSHPVNESISQDLCGRSASTKTKHSNEEVLNFKSPWIRGFELIHIEIDLWHHSKLPITEKEAGKESICVQPGSYKMPDGEVLSPDVLFCFDIRLVRVRSYFQKDYIILQYKIEFSEKEVLLTRSLPLNSITRLS